MSTKEDDLFPVPPSARTFSCWDFTSLWVNLVVAVPIYYLAGSLVELGMTWWQGITTIVLANSILLIPLILTAIPGTRYGIPFPVLARASFGLRGAQVPTVLRALVSCGWFGIETWIGGQSIHLLMPSSWKGPPLSWLGTSLAEFSCFMLFWTIQMCVLWRGMEGIRVLNKYSAPILTILTTALFAWAFAEGGGLGEMLPSYTELPAAEFWTLFFPSLTANVGSWSPLTLNIPDFSRYAKTQMDQIAGQVGLPLFMGVFTFIGLTVTSSTAVIFGSPISDPLHLVGKIVSSAGGVVGAIISVLVVAGIGLATVTTNVPANVVASANVLVTMNPGVFSFGRAALVTGLVGIVFQPWRVYQSSGSFVESWLVGYASITGSISGIMLTDYYVVRRMVLDVEDLYSINSKGAYYYWKGYNLKAVVALVLSIAPLVPGFLHQVGLLTDVAAVFEMLYGVSWFFGFFSAALVYWVLSYFASGDGPSKNKGSCKEKFLCAFEEHQQP